MTKSFPQAPVHADSRHRTRLSRWWQHWWQRPCGGREVMDLAVPLILSTASWTVMHFIDRVFLTWLSTEAIAAAMPAGMLHFSIVCFPMGVALYVNTFVAQYFGAQRPDRVGLVIWQAIFMGLACIPCMLLLIPMGQVLFPLLGHSQRLAELEQQYFHALAYGGGATVLGAAMASFFTGLGRSRIVLYVDVAAAVVNMVLDYGLIFGAFGLPEWGIFGAGIATAASLYFKIVLLAALMSRRDDRQTFQLVSGCRLDRELIGRLIRFGGPSGLQMFAEVAAFTAFVLLIGTLGERELAATTIAFSVNSIAFVPMFGLGIAVATMVGQQIGATNPALAARATWTSFVIGLVYTGVMAVLYWSVPDIFMWAHAARGGSEFHEVQAICRHLLRFVAAYCVLDMTQVVFSSAIKGAGDMRFVLAVTLGVSPMPVVIGWLGLRYWGWGLYLFWSVVTVWICSLGWIYLFRFRSGIWQTKRVIEVDVPAG